MSLNAYQKEQTMIKNFLTAFIILLTTAVSTLQGETVGKVDVGPAFLHIDILEHNKTVKRMDIWAMRGDASYFLYKGLYIKPVILYGNGGAAKGGIFSGSCGLGYCIPLSPKLIISPLVGVTYSHLWTKINLPIPFPPFQLKNIRENFKSWAPNVCLDVYYTFIPTWRICAGIQYSWSKTKTTLVHVGKFKSKSEGFAYSLMLEHDLSDVWSINIGAAYNLSLTKEKHGLRGSGIKAGITRWF